MPVNAQTAVAIDIGSATLVARGAALDIQLTVACEAGAQAFISVMVTQRSGNAIARGGSGASHLCTGAPEVLTVTAFQPESGGAPFRVGEALVIADISTCAPECQAISTTETVRVRKK
jgi:hypothetical protein